MGKKSYVGNQDYETNISDLEQLFLKARKRVERGRCHGPHDRQK